MGALNKETPAQVIAELGGSNFIDSNGTTHTFPADNVVMRQITYQIYVDVSGNKNYFYINENGQKINVPFEQGRKGEAIIDKTATKVRIDQWKKDIEAQNQREREELERALFSYNTTTNTITYKDINMAVENVITRGNASVKSIMDTIAPIIAKEYDNHRINEAFYSQVYLGALQVAMQFAYTASQNEQQMKFQEAQMGEMQQSVKDNRAIKTAEFYSQMIGMALSNNTAVPSNLYSGFFNIANALIRVV